MNTNKIIANAFFIDNKGKIIPVKSTHIQTIIDSPSKYGLSKQKILIEYIKTNEKIPSEGKARNKIILELLKKGFVRIRYNPKSACWRIQIHSVLTQKLKKHILKFCRDLQSGSITDLAGHPNNYDVEIHDTAEQSIFKGSLPETISMLNQ
jgi:hypothetical protein